MINMALLRPHGMAGVTLIGKNHFGSVYFPKDGGWSPRALHGSVLRTQPMGSYNALVDLIGHRHLGGKTMLYMLDGLYTAEHNESNVFKWASFGDHWASSMLISQDPVAIDSVALGYSPERAPRYPGARQRGQLPPRSGTGRETPVRHDLQPRWRRHAGQPRRARALEQRRRPQILA